MQLLPTVLLLAVGSTMGAPSIAESEAIIPSSIPIEDDALVKAETSAVHPRARPGCCNLDENGQLFGECKAKKPKWRGHFWLSF